MRQTQTLACIACIACIACSRVSLGSLQSSLCFLVLGFLAKSNRGFPAHSIFAACKPFHGVQVIVAFGIRRGVSFSLSEEDLCDGRQSEQVCYTASLWYAKGNPIEMAMVCGIDRQFGPHRVVRKKHDFTEKATRL